MKKKNLIWINKHINVSAFENKNVFITGGNSGIGLELAKICAELKANIFLLCRSTSKASRAKEEILRLFPSTKIEILEIDLADLSSIKKCAEEIKNFDVDFFVNNAGVYHLPFGYTKDGFEIIMGTNFLGTYFLNELLVPYFDSLPHKVNVLFESSVTSKFKHIDTKDLFLEKKYSKTKIYATSKVGINSMFFHYLDETHNNINFSLVHPGATYTPLIEKGYKNKVFQKAAKEFMNIFLNSVELAALCLLKGLSEQETCKLGPRHLFGSRGYPRNWNIKPVKNYKEVIKLANKLLKEVNY